MSSRLDACGSQLGSITEQFDIVNEFAISGSGRGQDHSCGNGALQSLVSQINKYNQVKTGFSIDCDCTSHHRV
ncbi:MAG: hypothetical protein R3C26_07625 [Calditrichia bacterium]